MITCMTLCPLMPCSLSLQRPGLTCVPKVHLSHTPHDLTSKDQISMLSSNFYAGYGTSSRQARWSFPNLTDIGKVSHLLWQLRTGITKSCYQTSVDNCYNGTACIILTYTINTSSRHYYYFFVQLIKGNDLAKFEMKPSNFSPSPVLVHVTMAYNGSLVAKFSAIHVLNKLLTLSLIAERFLAFLKFLNIT